MSDKLHPVGATWEARDSHGHIVRVWLHERNNYFESWRWESITVEGNRHRGDWATSYRAASDEAKARGNLINPDAVRFRRVK